MMPPGAAKRRAQQLLAEYKKAERKAENAAANAAAAAVEADAVAVRAAEAVAAAVAKPNIEFAEPGFNINFEREQSNRRRRRAKVTRTPHSSPASRGGRRTIRKRR